LSMVTAARDLARRGALERVKRLAQALQPAHCGSGPLHIRIAMVLRGTSATPPGAVRDPPPVLRSAASFASACCDRYRLDFTARTLSRSRTRSFDCMGKKDHTARNGQSSLKPPSATQERVLRLLGMTQRPLRSGELENALGLFPHEARSACGWLTENGYITS